MARVVIPGMPHHVTQRGVRRNDVFFCKADYEFYIDLLSAVRYVELNPVHANMVDHPEDFMWSSASAHLTGKNDQLVKVSPMLERVPNWQAYLESDLDDATIDTLRMHARTGHPLGDDAFVDMLNLQRDKILRSLKQGRKRNNDK